MAYHTENDAILDVNDSPTDPALIDETDNENDNDNANIEHDIDATLCQRCAAVGHDQYSCYSAYSYKLQQYLGVNAFLTDPELIQRNRATNQNAMQYQQHQQDTPELLYIEHIRCYNCGKTGHIARYCDSYDDNSCAATSNTNDNDDAYDNQAYYDDDDNYDDNYDDGYADDGYDDEAYDDEDDDVGR